MVTAGPQPRLKIGDSYFGVLQLIDTMEFEPIYTHLTDPTQFTVILMRMSTPPQTLSRIQQAIALAERREWPTGRLYNLRDEYREYINDAQRRNQQSTERAEYYRNLRAQRPPAPVPGPDELQLSVKVLTDEGNSYVNIQVVVSPNDELSVVEVKVRQDIGDAFQLPNRPMRFLYAGRQFRGDTIISSIPGLQSGHNIFVTF